MTGTPVTIRGALAGVRALFWRERSLIVALGAPFLFLPDLALRLLTPPPPELPAERTEVTLAAWWEALLTWAQANCGWYFLAGAIAVLGGAALSVLLLDAARPTVAQALTRAVRLWPRFLLASVLAAVPIGLGMWLIVPGLFLQGRFAAASAALVREQPLSAAGALARSWRVTGRANGAVFGGVALLFALQSLARAPVVPLDAWLRAPGHLNPFVLALVDALLAAITAGYQAATVLLGVVLYRRLAS